MLIDRRNLLRGLAVCALPLPGLLAAQEALLPLETPGLDHLDVMTPDVEASTRFYMGLFKTSLYAQPFQGGFRYFVLLGELGEGREVGYLAVGDARGRGKYIGHFCTTVVDWRQNSEAIFAAMKEAFAGAGLGEFPGPTGFGGIFADPDGIEIQFLPAPDTLVTAAEPSELVPWREGLVEPRGVDHVMLRVSDLERAVAYYEILYGPARRLDSGQAVFEFPLSDTRLVLEQTRYAYGEQPRIARFGIKTAPFDRDAVAAALGALGATLLPQPDAGGALRLRDPDGNELELNPQPA